MGQGLEAAKERCTAVMDGFDAGQLPHHLKVFTSLEVIAEERELRQHLTSLGAHTLTHQVLVGNRLETVTGDMPAEMIGRVFASGEYLDPAGQKIAPPVGGAHGRALSMMAGSARLVSVTGPAGAGKTSLLKAAKVLVEARGGRQVIVAPSGKAADVARQETGAQAGTIHQLLYAYGFRQSKDPVTGESVWCERVVPGQEGYAPVPRKWALGALDQVIVDEASMISQDTAVRLVQVVRESGAQLVLTGDYAQLSAVGRGGVLSMAQAAGVSVDLESVYRFKTADGAVDTEYADLSLAMRARQDPGAVFDALMERGLVQVHDSVEQAHGALAAAWVKASESGRSAVVSATTNEDASSVNTLVAECRARVEAAGLPVRADFGVSSSPASGVVVGMDGIPVRVGDTVMARQNDHDLGVLNRQSFRVLQTSEDSVRVQSVSDSRRQLCLPVEYVQNHVQAGYAVTTHGAQGMTVDEAHTLITGSSDGAGVYVGLSRGRNMNVAHFVAADIEDARGQFIAAMGAHRADEGLKAAREHLRTELRELGVYPRVRADHRVLAKELVPGDGVRVVQSPSGMADYVVLESTADEKNKYVLRLQEAGGAGTKLTVIDGDAIVRFMGPKVLPVSAHAKASLEQVNERVAQRRQVREYVQAVGSWKQAHEPGLRRLGEVRMSLAAYEFGLESTKKELRTTESKYFRPLFSYRAELSNATRAVQEAQQELEQAGIFRRRGARVRLEQAQQRLDEVKAAGSPDQGQIQALQSKVRQLSELVESASNEHLVLLKDLKGSMPPEPMQVRGRGWILGAGLGVDGSVDVRLSARFEQGVVADQAYIRKVLAPDPVSRAAGALHEVRSVEAREKKKSVEASYQRHWDPPSRGMGPSLGR